MPAFRSRTVHWRRSLEQLAERGGAIEVSVAPPGETDPEASVDFVWRLRVVGLGESWIDIEEPVVLGRTVPVPAGTEVVGAIAVGPNRWIFRTVCLGPGGPASRSTRSAGTLRLRMPEQVERSRRANLRVDAATLELPTVRLWPLLEAASVRPLERAIELAEEGLRRGEPDDGGSARLWERESLRPNLGPEFSATLMNIGGGGAGLRVEPECAALLAQHRLFWMVLDLHPEAPLPLCSTLRVAHTHLDASGRTYAGVAFETAGNARHAALLGRQILALLSRRHERAAA